MSKEVTFTVNDYVVYPAHGVGMIVGEETQTIGGMELQVFVISFIKEKKIRYAISFVSPKIVDRLNVTGAVNLGALRVVKKINSKVFDKYRLVVDKGIKIKGFEFESYIKADENFPAVSLASIVAKVYRDRYMRRVSRVFRKYGFESHVGYGTKKHIEVIVKYGALDIHRKSFIEKFLF